MNILVTPIYFILIITWSLAYGCGQQWNRRDKKCRQIDDDFDDHVDAAVPCGAHHPMPNEAQPGLHSKPLDATIGRVLVCIVGAAAMVDDFGRKHKTLTKNYF